MCIHVLFEPFFFFFFLALKFQFIDCNPCFMHSGPNCTWLVGPTIPR